MTQILQNADLRFRDSCKKAEKAVWTCRACQTMQQSSTRKIKGSRVRGDRPEMMWKVDFTEVRPSRYDYRYLLVMIDSFSRWVEAFPTKNETAKTVVKVILEEIVSRYETPWKIGSDNRPVFMAQITRDLAKQLGIDWKLHCAYTPQSSGQVKKKWIEQLKRPYPNWQSRLTLLPFTLFRVRNTPYTGGYTPYEIL